MFVSVVVRSFKRSEALKELVARLREQSYPSFEVVILEQSDDPTIVEYLRALGDSRVHVIVAPPHNPPAARNEAIRHAKGGIILLINNDDLPLGTDWIERHANNYEDTDCMGVVGRLVADPEHIRWPRFRIVRFFAMRYTIFMEHHHPRPQHGA